MAYSEMLHNLNNSKWNYRYLEYRAETFYYYYYYYCYYCYCCYLCLFLCFCPKLSSFSIQRNAMKM